MTSSASGAPTEREFLGRKIYSAAMPAFPIPGAGASPPGRSRALQYAATSAYVAMSSDSSMIEEFLRSSESQSKKLRETAGLVEAAQKVTGPGTGLFGFENQAETMKATFEMLRKNPPAATNSTSSSSSLNPLASAVDVSFMRRSSPWSGRIIAF